MKVLLNGSMYAKKATGVALWVREGYKNLLAQNAITYHDEYSLYVYSEEGLQAGGWIKKIRLPQPLQAVLRNALSIHRIIWNFFFLPRLAKRYDKVFSFSSHGSPYIKKQIIVIHDLICMAFPSQHKAQYLYFKHLMPSIIKSCETIITVSQYTKGEVIKYYGVPPEKIKVIYGAADHIKKIAAAEETGEERDIREWLKNKKFFLAVGASYVHKNIERVIAAARELSKDNLLIIVGSGNSYYNGLKKNYSNDQIHFLDYVSTSTLAYLYTNCIVNVYVSLYEGMGLPPYEAAVYNTVTIGSGTTALPEIYGDALYYVNPESTEEIREAMKRFAANEIDKERYRKFFPALLEKYTWQKTALQIAALFNEPEQKVHQS